jgi:hypothetical protein
MSTIVIPTTWEEIYAAIEGELRHGFERFGRTPSRGQHTVGEWVLYMEDYIAEAREACTREKEPESSELALDVLRKVVAMGIHCMWQNGLVKREE